MKPSYKIRHWVSVIFPSYTNLLNSSGLFKWEYSFLANENTCMHQTWILFCNGQKKNEEEWLLGEQVIVELLLMEVMHAQHA